MDEIKDIEGWWRGEFQYLLNRKILSLDELSFLFGQIRYIIGRERESLLSLLKESEGFVVSWRKSCEEAEAKVKELETPSIWMEESKTVCKLEAKVKKLEHDLEIAHALRDAMRIKANVAVARVKELEEEVRKYRYPPRSMDEKIWFVKQREIDNLTEQLEKANIRVKELETYTGRLIDEGIVFQTEKCKAEVKVKELEADKESKDRIIEAYMDKRRELEEKIKKLEPGSMRVMDRNDKLESIIEKLEAELNYGRDEELYNLLPKKEKKGDEKDE